MIRRLSTKEKIETIPKIIEMTKEELQYLLAYQGICEKYNIELLEWIREKGDEVPVDDFKLEIYQKVRHIERTKKILYRRFFAPPLTEEEKAQRKEAQKRRAKKAKEEAKKDSPKTDSPKKS